MPAKHAANSEWHALKPTDTIDEATRKILYGHFQTMLAHEAGTRAGEDIEALHDMRVASRRIRTTLQITKDYTNKEHLRPYRQEIRQATRTLGLVRDMDVFWEKTDQYRHTFSHTDRPDLTLLRRVFQEEYQRARNALNNYLDSERYANFKTCFGEFLETPPQTLSIPLCPSGKIRAHRVQHVVPVLIYQRWATVQAFDEWMMQYDAPLTYYHRLRIAAKRLRYTLENFRDVLGQDAIQAIEHLKKLQDHLGDLQDATVAAQRIQAVMRWGQWNTPVAQPAHMPFPDSAQGAGFLQPDINAYLKNQQEEIQMLKASFPQVWSIFQDREFLRLIANAVSVL